MVTITQEEASKEFKNYLKSYNLDIDIISSDTYWDIEANATGALASLSSYQLQQIAIGNSIDNASSEMLDEWASQFGMTPRKTGSYATGQVMIKSTSYPVSVPIDTLFTLGDFVYSTLQDYTLNADSFIVVQAINIGVEYDIVNTVNLSNSINVTATTSAIYGGQGVETDEQLRNRIKLQISNRVVSGTKVDYLKQALSYYPYASVYPIYIPGTTFIYGVDITVANSINDYILASQNPEINQIELSSDEIVNFQSLILNYGIVNCVVNVSTVSTQTVDNLIIYVNSNAVLSADDINLIRQETRMALLKYKGDYLTPHSLVPNITNTDIYSYYFNNFYPIKVTSPQLDSINIGVVQV